MESEQPELDDVKLDIDAAHAANLTEEQLVASQADPDTVLYLKEVTDCYVNFTIGNSWLTTVTTTVEAIDEYGPQRTMLDTDPANMMGSDVFASVRSSNSIPGNRRKRDPAGRLREPT